MIEINGNNHDELKKAFRQAEENQDKEPHKPTVIIADTIKGYGVSFMQNDILWHYRFPHDGWEYDTAVNELHQNMPDGVIDPYTQEGEWIPEEVQSCKEDDNDHTLSLTWNLWNSWRRFYLDHYILLTTCRTIICTQRLRNL